MQSAHNTAIFSDWVIFLNQDFYLVMMLMSISQSQHNLFLPDFHHTCPSHTHTYIYICITSHILWKNLQVYNIEGTAQQEKYTNSQEHAEL